MSVDSALSKSKLNYYKIVIQENESQFMVEYQKFISTKNEISKLIPIFRRMTIIKQLLIDFFAKQEQTEDIINSSYNIILCYTEVESILNVLIDIEECGK